MARRVDRTGVGRPGPGRPRKRFGQHFLDAAWADKVVEAIGPARSDRFLEIGPGPGALTVRLAPRVAELIAVEVDRELAASLRQASLPNTTIVQGDVLETDLPAIARGAPLRVAGNLPYNISSPILFKLLRASRLTPGALVDATVMLQYEVAERLIAPVGTHEYGVLTILTALSADVRRVLTLPPGAFRPPPKVRSAVVRLTFRPPPVPIADEALFERLVRTLFMQRRKMLVNSLAPLADALHRDAADLLAAADLDGRRRPETLQLTELARLVDAARPG